MDFKKINTVINEAGETLTKVYQMNDKTRQIKENGIVIQTAFGLDCTKDLDDRTKLIIQKIILPELEEKREELIKYLDKLMSGGIKND